MADRFLELTKTIETRKMRSQFLDRMDLERERGITIKMQPVRMLWHPGGPELIESETLRVERRSEGQEYILNLIDTPGHIDFTYEVSRALLAVEGAILLVDATKGVQAQTISNLELARRSNIKIIPVINKIDMPDARIPEVKQELTELLECKEEDIFLVSAKTGEGVERVLQAIIEKIPVPQSVLGKETLQALIFDSHFSPHKGVLAYVRVFEGSVKSGDKLKLFHKKAEFQPIEVGTFSPDLIKKDFLEAGEIGYIATNLKDPSLVRVGDTITGYQLSVINSKLLGGYSEPKPVVWASIFPEDADEFEKLKDAFLKLRLNDASLSFETEGSTLFGRSLRVGFLGLLHLDITIERIIREFGIEVVVASPSIEYEIVFQNGEKVILRNAELFDEQKRAKEIWEPWFIVSIVGRSKDLGAMIELLQKNEGELKETKSLSGERILTESLVPLRKLVSDFFDDLKSATQGYGSMSYEFFEKRKVDLVKLSILIAEKEVPQFAKLVTRGEVESEARGAIDKLYHLLPKQLFVLKIQAVSDGRILASRTMSAAGKNVTAKLYGGDRTRKMKLWKKQKKGKKRLQAHADIDIPHEVYLKMIKRG